MTVVFVGQAPARTALTRRAFSGTTASGRLLARLCGAPDAEALRSRVRLVNLASRYPGAAKGKGDEFDLARARRHASRVASALPPGATVVCLGRKVWAAFGLQAGVPWWTVAGLRYGVDAVLMPHPSRVSHYWNDPVRVLDASERLRAIVGTGWPREQGDLLREA